MAIAAIGIDLDRTVKAVEDFGGVFSFTPWPIMEHHTRRSHPMIGRSRQELPSEQSSPRFGGAVGIAVIRMFYAIA